MTTTRVHCFLLGVLAASVLSEVTALARCETEYEIGVDCVANYGNCSDTTMPCCREQARNGTPWESENFVCFQFGPPTCLPLSSIKNLANYAQLVKNISDTNYSVQLDQYERNVTVPMGDSPLPLVEFTVGLSLALMFMAICAGCVIIGCRYPLF